MSIKITKQVIDDISDTIGSKRPESGGFLFGPLNKDIITHFLFDDSAQTTGASYSPDPIRSGKKVQEFEITNNVVLKGIIHSHPGSIISPSSGDALAVKKYFELNPGISKLYMPIGVFDLNEYKLHGYYFLNTQESKSDISHKLDYISDSIDTIDSFNNIEIDQTIVLLDELVSQYNGEVCEDYLQCSAKISYLIDIDTSNLLLSIPRGFPCFSPIISLFPNDDKCNSTQFSIPNWQGDKWEEIINIILEDFVNNSDTGYIVTPGTWQRNGVSIIQNNQILPGFYPTTVPQNIEDFNTLLSERINSETWSILNNNKIAVFGCGSGGSYLVDILARSGIGEFSLIDNDKVELPNLTRSFFDINDIGKTKVEALSERILKIRPNIVVNTFCNNVLELTEDQIEDIIKNSDLIIAVTDTPKAQSRINRWAYFLNKPTIYAGLYERAEGGEICTVLPEYTQSCYDCSLGIARDLSDQLQDDLVIANSRKIDYSSGQLAAEPGLISDIHFLDSLVSKLSLSILMQKQNKLSKSSLDSLYNSIIKNQLIFSAMIPNYWIFPSILGTEAKECGILASHHTIWLNPERNDNCPVCGNNRINPREVDEVNLSSKVSGIRQKIKST